MRGVERALYAYGQSEFPKLGPDWTLEHVEKDVLSVADALTQHGYACPSDIGPGIDEDFVRDLQASIDKLGETEDHVVVVYLNTHGEVREGDFYFVSRDTETGRYASTAIPARQVLTAVLESRRVRKLLIIVDACYGGSAAHDVAKTVANAHDSYDFARAGEGVWVLAASRPREEAVDGEFAGAFVRALKYWEHRTGRAQEYIGIDTIADTVSAEMRTQQAYQSHAGIGMPQFFRNPNYIANSALGLPIDTRNRILVDVRDILDHWSPKARGLQLASQGITLFTGRDRVMELLRTHVSPPGVPTTPPLCVVTGNPGSGKSAILGRLVLQSESFRELMDAVDPSAPYEQFDIAAALIARGKGVWDLRSELEAIFGCRFEEIPSLVEARERPAAIVIDSLDEALEPRTVATDFVGSLEGLTRSTGNLRIVVGTRRHLLPELGKRHVHVDIDAKAYCADTSITDYAKAVFRYERSFRPDIADHLSGDPVALDHVAREIDRVSNRNFLVAQIYAQSVARQEFDTRQKVNDFLASSEGDLAEAFRSDLARFADKQTAVLELLAPLALVSLVGLPREFWAAAATALAGHNSYDDQDIDWLLDAAGSYIQEVEANGRAVYRLYHHQVAELYRGGRLGTVDYERLYHALHDRVPIDSNGRRWKDAHPFVLGSIARIASLAGEIDALVTDAGFLIHVDPVDLVPYLGSVSAPSARRASASYRLYSQYLSTKQATGRATQLRLAAMQEGAEDLASDLGNFCESGWLPDWVAWRDTSARAKLGSVADRAVASAIGLLGWTRVVVLLTVSGRLATFSLDSLEVIGIPIQMTDSGRNLVLFVLDGRLHAAVVTTAGFVEHFDLDLNEPRKDLDSRLREAIGSAHQIRDIAVAKLNGTDCAIYATTRHVHVLSVTTGEPLHGPWAVHDPVSRVCVVHRYGRCQVALLHDSGEITYVDLESGVSPRIVSRLPGKVGSLLAFPGSDGGAQILIGRTALLRTQDARRELTERVVRESAVHSYRGSTRRPHSVDSSDLGFIPSCVGVVHRSGTALLAIGGTTGVITLVDPLTLTPRLALGKVSSELVASVADDPWNLLNGQLVFIDDHGTVHLFELEALESELERSGGEMGEVYELATFCEDATVSRVMRLTDRRDGYAFGFVADHGSVARVRRDASRVVDVYPAFGIDRRWLVGFGRFDGGQRSVTATIVRGNYLRVYDAASLQQVTEIGPHVGVILALSVGSSPSLGNFLVVSEPTIVVVYSELEASEPTTTTYRRGSEVFLVERSILISRNREPLLVEIFDGGLASITDLKTGQRRGRLVLGQGERALMVGTCRAIGGALRLCAVTDVGSLVVFRPADLTVESRRHLGLRDVVDARPIRFTSDGVGRDLVVVVAAASLVVIDPIAGHEVCGRLHFQGAYRDICVVEDSMVVLTDRGVISMHLVL